MTGQNAEEESERRAAPHRMLVRKPTGLLLRLARSVLWPHPRIYWRCGALRSEPLPDWNFDVWVGGFPRSGNTFLWKVLERAYLRKRVIGHLHVPPVIIRALRSGRPGALLIRSPRDAVLSWSIFTGLPVRHCLEYYIDFHRILWPYRAEMLLIEFDELTGALPRTLARLERRFALPPSFIESRTDLRDEVYQAIDAMFRRHDAVDEMRVARPSEARHAHKQQLSTQLDRSPKLRAKLHKAEQLHAAYLDVLRASGAAET